MWELCETILCFIEKCLFLLRALAAPNSSVVYPICFNVSETIVSYSTSAVVVISPETIAWPWVIIVSHATLAFLSWSRIASKMESDILSHTLSGCPSVTDSDVKIKFLFMLFL